MSSDPLELFGATKTLEAVVRAAAMASPPWRLVEIIVQDEYTHDVVMASEDRWAALDVT